MPSHDPGVIQGQVNLCAAMTNYVRDHEVEPGQHHALHTSRREGWTRALMSSPPDEFENRTRRIRSLIDTLFTTDRERQQIACLWGRGSYHR